MDKRTIYITGAARTAMDNAITRIYGIFYLAFELTQEGEVIDVDCNATLELTRNFIKKLFLGQSFTNAKSIDQEVTSRYFGTSAKAILAAYHDALMHYRQLDRTKG